jgi:tight adherence protein B
MSVMVLSIIVFVAVTAMVAAAAFAFGDFGKTKAEDRLDILAGLKTPELESRGLLKEEAIKEGVQGISGVVNRFAARMGNVRNLFVQADSPISVNSFIAISAGSALLGMVGAVVARSPLPLYPIIALFYGVLPL